MASRSRWLVGSSSSNTSGSWEVGEVGEVGEGQGRVRMRVRRAGGVSNK